MSLLRDDYADSERSNDLSTPAIKSNRWRFGDLAAAQLLPLVQRYLLAQNADINWQLIWLNNDGCPVIGLLPKVSWQVFFNTAGATRRVSRRKEKAR